MLRLLLPLFELALTTALQTVEFRAWLTAVDGPGAVTALERIREHADEHCRNEGW